MKSIRTCCVFEEKHNTKEILEYFFSYYSKSEKIRLEDYVDVSTTIEQCEGEEIFFILDAWNDNICDWLIHAPEQCSAVYLFVYQCPSIENIKQIHIIQKELGIYVGIDTFYSFFSLLNMQKYGIPKRIEYCSFNYMFDKMEGNIRREIEKNITLLSYYLYLDKPIQILQYASPLVKNITQKFSNGGIFQMQWGYNSSKENIEISFFDKMKKYSFDFRTNSLVVTQIQNSLKIDNISQLIFPLIKHPTSIGNFFDKLQKLKIQKKAYMNIEEYDFL